MLYFFRLIRWKNLIIIAFTMFVMRYGIIEPMLANYNFVLQFDLFHFSLLIITTLLIAAAGYIINDYYDAAIDAVNRPDSVIIDKHVSKSKALTLSVIFNLMGITLAVYLSYYIKVPRLGVIFVLITGLLWFYSESYKMQLIVGNLIIAVLAAFVPFIVYIFEIPLVNATYRNIIIENSLALKEIRLWIVFYSVFAFLITLIREIIKDIEDFEGDHLSGRDTLPLVIGVRTTRYIVSLLILILVSLLIYVYFQFMRDPISLTYILGLIIAPLVWLFVKLYKASEKKDYHFLSSLCKWIMLSGILYGLIARFLIQQMSL